MSLETNGEDTFLPQKVKAILKLFTRLSFVAKSWHFIFLEITNPVKSRIVGFRFETVYKLPFLSAALKSIFTLNI